MHVARIHRWRKRGILAAALSLAAIYAVSAAGPALAADESITVNFATTGGAPTYRASGWIYGMTENGANPPDNFFRDVKFRTCGPAVRNCRAGGWVGGGYDRRWNATRRPGAAHDRPGRHSSSCSPMTCGAPTAARSAGSPATTATGPTTTTSSPG